MYKRISVMIDNNPDTLIWAQGPFKSKVEIDKVVSVLKEETVMLLHAAYRLHHIDDTERSFSEKDYVVTIIDCDINDLIQEEEQKLFNRMMHLYCLKMIGPIKPDTNISEYSRKRRALNFNKGTEAYYEMLCLINNPNLLKEYLEKYDN